MSRIALVLLTGFVVGVGACTWLLPERFAVNAPMRQLLLGRGAAPPSDEAIAARMRVPDGFSIGLYAEGIDNARILAGTDAGDLLVSSPGTGRVVLLERDRDGDGRADGQRPLLEGLERPHGIALRDGWLYVAQASSIGRIRFDATAGAVSGPIEDLVTGIPKGGNHWTRNIAFGPDDALYLTIGSTCNACEEEDERRASMMRFEPDGSAGELYATGLRNTVGFDWQPATGALYGTDNGRDLLGDDIPPCELNRIERGAFYGWPIAYGDRVPDPDHGAGRQAEIDASLPPEHGFGAHNAPLGIHFLRGEALPDAYSGSALVALHGSWNRTKKDGYKVVSLHWEDDGRIVERDFATGFLIDEDVSGRPVDIEEGVDGAIYVSDDYAGAIWRITADG